jgi:hypothetical protein
MPAFVAFLDSCVLYPATLRDVLLTIAEAGICQIKWSADVLDEVEKALVSRTTVTNPKEALAGAKYLRGIMEDAFPEAMVEKYSYANLEPYVGNHADDRHVLAAAIAARADVLVTCNIKHFPPDICCRYGIEVQTPDIFLLFQFELAPDRFLVLLDNLSRERHEPMNSVQAILSALMRTTPKFSHLALSTWRSQSRRE